MTDWGRPDGSSPAAGAPGPTRRPARTGRIGLLMAVLAVGLSVAGNGAAQTAGTVSFGRTDLANISTGTAFGVGDFNGDGKPDMAVANYNPATVTILLGDGTGGFTVAQQMPVGPGPISVAVVDLNGDGKVDLAVANYNGDSVSFLRGNGTGQFTNVGWLSVGSVPSSVTAGDFNGDGLVDLAVANLGANTVSVLLGDGAFGFTRTDLPVGNEPRMLTAVDLNLDGRTDLAVADYLAGAVSILLGDGAGHFTRSDVPSAPTPRSIGQGDINGDGIPDLITGNYDTATASVLIGDGTGGFTRTDVPVGTNPRSVAVADFNGDGKADIVVANHSTNTVSVLIGDGAGHFARTDVGVSNGPYALAVGDFNGDDRPDVVAANQDANSVSVLLDQTAAAARPPTCVLRRVIPGPPERDVMGALDLGSGIAGVQVTAATNAVVSVAPFGAGGAFSEVEVVVTRADPATAAQVTLAATDETGRVTTCSNTGPPTSPTSSTTTTTSPASSTTTTTSPASSTTTTTSPASSTTTTTSPSSSTTTTVPPSSTTTTLPTGSTVFSSSSTTTSTGAGTPTPFVSSFTPTALRQDFSGWVGSTFSVGAQDVQVTSLGRWVVAGNTATHTVKVVDAATGNDLASATVVTAGAPPGGFRYASLATPLTLRANASYYLVSLETAGGDTWYDYNTRLVTTAGAADTGVVYAMAGTPASWVKGGSPGNGFGPSNFLYTGGVATPSTSTSTTTGPASTTTTASVTTTTTAPPTTTSSTTTTTTPATSSTSSPATTTSTVPATGTPFVSSFTPTALRQDFTGWVGTTFSVGAQNLQVTSLGRWVVAGNTGSHTVKVVDAGTRADVASATVTLAGAAAGTFRYAALATPVTLRAGGTYYLVTQETAGGDAWYDYDTRQVTTAGAAAAGAVYGVGANPTSWASGGNPGNGYGPPNFLYTTGSSSSSTTTTTTTGSSTTTTTTTGPTSTTTTSTTITSTTTGPTTTSSTAVSSTAVSSTTTTTTVGVPTPFVTSFTPTNLRRDFSGWVGSTVTVGPRDLQVSSLGRWVVAGNIGTHTVKLVDAATGTDVASVTVSTAGAPAGTFRTTALAAPVTLRAGATYYLVSLETAGGDTWYDYDTHIVTSSGAADAGAVYALAGTPGNWVAGGSPGNGYGPATFIYQ